MIYVHVARNMDLVNIFNIVHFFSSVFGKKQLFFILSQTYTIYRGSVDYIVARLSVVSFCKF